MMGRRSGEIGIFVPGFMMTDGKDIFNRTERLVGPAAMQRLQRSRVVVFGVGGVGSWCAEALVRSGIGHLTIVDADCVCASNVNRQLMATTRTIGAVKVDALRERLLEIDPDADVEAVRDIYTEENRDRFDLASYDYIVDAIDSLHNKASLILRASEAPGMLLSSMGAALKMDPTRVRVAEFWEVRGCPLGAALRKKFRKEGTFPAKRIPCVFSDEVLPNRGADREEEKGGLFAKAVINGTTAPVTGIFGLTLAGLITEDICRKAWEEEKHRETPAK